MIDEAFVIDGKLYVLKQKRRFTDRVPDLVPTKHFRSHHRGHRYIMFVYIYEKWTWATYDTMKEFHQYGYSRLQTMLLCPSCLYEQIL